MPGYCSFCVPSESISHAIRLYQWFCLRFGEVEERHAGRGIMVTDETIRQWCRKSGPVYPHKFGNDKAAWVTHTPSTKCLSPFKGYGSISGVRLIKMRIPLTFSCSSSVAISVRPCGSFAVWNQAMDQNAAAGFFQRSLIALDCHTIKWQGADLVKI